MARRSDSPTSPTDDDSPHPDDEGTPGGAIRELVVTIVIAVAVAWTMQAFLVKPYQIPSGSMENTIRCKDRVLADRISYRFKDPKRGQVVVFHPPAATDSAGNPVPERAAGGSMPYEPGQARGKPVAAKPTYIKRVIGTPGDTIEVRNHHVWVNGKKIREPYLKALPTSASDFSSPAHTFGPYVVPRNSYLMMGDNRDHSQDGRFFGPVPRDFVLGKAFWVYWPPSRVGSLPSKDPGRRGPDSQDPNCDEFGVQAQ